MPKKTVFRYRSAQVWEPGYRSLEMCVTLFVIYEHIDVGLFYILANKAIRQ